MSGVVSPVDVAPTVALSSGYVFFSKWSYNTIAKSICIKEFHAIISTVWTCKLETLNGVFFYTYSFIVTCLYGHTSNYEHITTLSSYGKVLYATIHTLQRLLIRIHVCSTISPPSGGFSYVHNFYKWVLHTEHQCYIIGVLINERISNQ